MATEPSTKLTYDDYVLLPNDGRRYEILDGELYVNPAPNTKHQRLVGKLYRLLCAFVEDHELGEVFVSPYDVVLSPIDVVEPDLVFVSSGRMHIITDANAQGTPDLVVEVLSEGTRRYDESFKLKRYERFGIAEYWIVDPDEERVSVYRAAAGRLHLMPAGDAVTSPLLPGFTLDSGSLFEGAR